MILPIQFESDDAERKPDRQNKNSVLAVGEIGVYRVSGMGTQTLTGRMEDHVMRAHRDSGIGAGARAMERAPENRGSIQKACG